MPLYFFGIGLPASNAADVTEIVIALPPWDQGLCPPRGNHRPQDSYSPVNKMDRTVFLFSHLVPKSAVAPREISLSQWGDMVGDCRATPDSFENLRRQWSTELQLSRIVAVGEMGELAICTPP